MSDDFRDYFNSRLNQEIERDAQRGISKKYDEVQGAANLKIQQLEALKQRSTKVRALKEGSLVAQMGLNPDGIIGTVTNAGVATVAEIGDALATGIATPLELAGQKEAGASVRSFLNNDGAVAPREDTWEEQSGVLRRAADLGVAGAKSVVSLGDAVIGIGDIATLGKSGKGWDALGRDSKATQAFLDDLYSPEQKLANANVEEAKGFLGTLETMLENPSTITTGIMESLAPMLAGGKIGQEVLSAYPKISALIGTKAAGIAGAVGEGTIMAGSQAEGIRQETADKELSLKQAALAVGTGVMGAGVARLGNRVAGKLGAGDIDEALVTGSLAKTPRGYATSVGLSGAIESGEEGLQSAGETVLKNLALDKTWSEGIGEAAAQGMLTAAPLGGVAGFGERVRTGATRRADLETRGAAQDAAIATGDVTALTDPKSPVYAPEKAIDALLKNSALPTATPETKQGNLEKANAIIAELETKRDGVKASLDSVSPATLAEMQAGLAKAVAEGNTELVPEYEAAIAEIDPKLVPVYTKELEQLDGRITRAQTSIAQFNDEVQSTTEVDPASLNTAVDSADAAAVSARTAAVDKVITLSMAIPERLDAAVATELASNPDNGLTSNQRSYLRAFSDARVAENSVKQMDGVSLDIMNGGQGFDGLVDYRARVAQALATGNKTQAGKYLATLSKFATDHEAKASVVEQAWAQGKGTQTERSKDGTWAVSKLRRSPMELKRSGDLAVNTERLGEVIRSESDAINKVLSELNAAYAVKFSKGASNVTNVPKRQPVSEATVDEQQAPEVVGRDGEATTSERVAAAGTGSAEVATPGVVAPESQSTEPVEATAAEPEASPDAGQTKGAEQSNEETVADAVVAGSSESAEQTTEVPDGKLAIMASPSVEGTAYNLKNLIADYFTQSAGKDTDSTQRPLVAVQDFLSKGWEKVGEFTDFNAESESQVTALRVFKEKAAVWSKTIQLNLKRRKNAQFFFTDMMQFLITDEAGALDLEENLKTAMSYAAFSWIAENATRNEGNTDEEINLILGRNEEHPIERHERDILRWVGTRQNVVSNALGQRALQSLGLQAKKDAPLDLMPRLESSIGAHIFKMLMDQDILVRSEVAPEVMAELTGKESKGAKHQFLSLARDGNKLAAKADEVFKASMGSQGILDRLFGVEAGLKDPGLKPIPFVQKTTRNTDQAVPSKLKEIMDLENAGASYVRQDMYDLMQHLGNDIKLQMAGADTVDPTETHVVNRPSREAKNAGLQRELDRGLEFFGTMDLEAPIYFDHSVWKQQRVGIATNVVNPQTSKIHRHMLFRKSWETEVDRDDPASLENFQLRVAEGLGVKTDKQGNEKSIAAFNKKVADPAIQAAVAVLQKRLAGADLNQAEQETLLAGVKKGGENMHSLDALMGLAHEARAVAAKKTKFPVQLMGEVDGVTNGPMLSHLMLGAANSVEDLFSLLNRGGFYEAGNEHNQYNLWREAAGHFDLYEVTAGHMVTSMQKIMATGVAKTKFDPAIVPADVKQIAAAIYTFTGQLVVDEVVAKAGRNIIKTPLTAMVFGSSVGSAVESMANKFVESIYAGIEDAAAKEDPAAIVAVIKSINVLLNHAGAPLLSESMTTVQLMEYEIQGKQLVGVKRTFTRTLGQAVAETMESDFAPYIAQRKQVNLAAQTSFALYNAVYTGLRDEMVAELVKSGDIAVNEKTGEPLHDLNAAQENELQKRLSKMAPVAHTRMSKDSGSLKAGLRISKSARKLTESKTVVSDGKEVERRTPYEGDAMFATGFKDNGATTTQTRGYERSETGPGVAMVPMLVHSTDSAISHYAAALGEVLNVHDAHGAGLATFEETARNLNQATWNAMLSYSPATEIFDALSRTVEGLAGLIAEGKLTPAAKQNLSDAIARLADKQEMDTDTFLLDVITATKGAAYRADSMKLQALGQMQAIDQYAMQGGNYVVTEADRKAAEAARAKLTSEIETSVTAAAEKIQAELVESEAKEELPLEEDKPVKTSVFGTLGKSTAGDPAVVKFLADKPEATAREVLEFLYRTVSAGTAANREFNIKLIRSLNKTVNPGLKMQMITADTKEADVSARPENASLGWYVPTDEMIYMLGPDFAGSNMQVEVLLHEMVHAATANRLASLGAKDPIRVELEALLKEVQEYTKANNLKFDDALKNVDELIAYGMTNKAFQEMLKKVQMKSSTLDKMATAMSTFVDLLARMLGFKNAAEANGLGVLVTNVVALMAMEAQGQTNMRTMSMAAALQTYSTIDIHNALNAGDVTPEFDLNLRNILSGIVDKLHGPFGSFKESLMKDQALSPMDVWLKAINTGVAPFASSVMVSPLKVSEQEAHAMEQVEAVMTAVLDRNENTSRTAYKELSKLYVEMRDTLTPADFGSQDEYDFIFGLTQDLNNRSDHLARFAAFGLAHQEFNKLLQRKTAVVTKSSLSGKPFSERLQIIWESILEFFVGEITKTFSGQAADAKLKTLVGQLVDIEAKKRILIEARAKGLNPMATVEQGIQTAGLYARDQLAKAAGSNFVQNNRSNAVRAAGSLARIYVNDQVEGLMNTLVDYRDKSSADKHGVIMGLLTDARGPGQVISALSLAGTNNQRLRKAVITDTSRIVMNAFSNQGKDLDPAAKGGITQLLLRTGLHNLLGTLTMGDLENVLGSTPALLAEIATLEAQLSGPFKAHFIHSANALAYFKMTGKVGRRGLMMNAHNIARLYGTVHRKRMTGEEAATVEPIIEKLIALYAVGYAAPASVSAVRGVLGKENARTDGGNGVEFVLALHKTLEKESKDRLFRHQGALAMHGYTPEIINPHTQIKTANESEGKDLLLQGYKQGGRVNTDPADPNKEAKHIYVLKDGGLMPFLTGVISYTGKNAKGTKLHSGYMNPNTADGMANATLQADVMAAIPTTLAAGPRPDLSKSNQTFMAPVVNPQGDIVNFRYLMQDTTKNALLDRDNRFEKILGTHAGSIFDKESTTSHNKLAIAALKEIYNDQKGTNAESFVLVGPKSPDVELRQIWSMLPDDTKAVARSVWGKDGMMVRKDQLVVMFGYRKNSLAEAFRKDPRARGHLETLFVAVMENSLAQFKKFKDPGISDAEANEYAKRAAVLVTRGERAWQELVYETKDILVVKTGVTMMGNIWSNLSLLAISGVPLVDMVKHHLVAFRGYRQYHADSEKISDLEALLNTGLTQGREAQIKRDLALARDSLSRNPVAELIDAGLMSSIVEDVAQEDDIYSYKSEFARRTEGALANVNPTLLSAAKQIYMAHDTKLYQGLSRVTQLSDFVARYTLYQHSTTRKINPLSKKEAIFEASETFINYDIPMHPTMQYLDDMGITMFTKYFLRIQRVLLKLAKENPARVFLAFGLDALMNLGPIVLEGSMFRKIGNNPFGPGALNFFGSLDELLTVSQTMAVFKTGSEWAP